MAEVELQQIGQYPIIELLYTNATSEIYRGRQRKKEVIIKKLSIALGTHEAKEAFLLRAKQLKKLKNRNIVNVLDIGFDGDYGYLVMESTTGEPLAQRIPPGTIKAPDEVKRLLSPIADALHYAHVNNTLHRNLRPSTIIAGERGDILLADFSLALAGVEETLRDEALAVPYMAPEHLMGQPTFASDQYSLAVMAYEWLCGRRPYQSTERAQLLQEQQSGPFPFPRSLNSEISSAVENVIIQALAYDASERFPHTLEFSRQYLGALIGFAVKSSEPLGMRRTPTTPLIPITPKPVLKLPEQNGHKEPDNKVEKIPETPAPDLTIHNIASEQPIESNEAESASQSSPEVLVPTEEREATIQPISKFGQSELRLRAMIAEDLQQGGVLSQSLPGYEERPAQIEMATLIARALTSNTPAIIEAGTGTGKSLAYLVPVVRSGKVAIVSTANKALQEQLFYKDIPFVQKYIKNFEAALVKGVNNYVCLDRVDTEQAGMQFYTKNREFKRLLHIIEDPESDFNGDFETLGFQLPGDVRGRVATDSDQCAWSKCGSFGDCYVRQMRERAERAQIIVVNHTLLLLDAAIGGFLLPERDVIILDEAHHLEEEATRSFTVTIGPAQIQSLLAQRMLRDHSQPSLQDDAIKAAQETWSRLEFVANPGYKGRVNLDAPLEEGKKLATIIASLGDSLRKQRPKDLPEKEGQLYDKLLKRTQNLADNIRTVFSVAEPSKFVYYVDRVEGVAGRIQLQASAAPLDVTKWLKERLFDKCNVICTSATLATIGPNPLKPEDKGPNFTYFRKRIGLEPAETPEVLEDILPLAFDYESNALLYLPRDLPAPAYGTGSDDYMKAIAREMYRLVKLSRGRAFLLFSSKRMLDKAFELMAPHLDFPLLKQGDMTRIELTRRFRTEEGSVLFGLKSFWEGVDIAGDALSLVVIDKLPFDPPDDPVHEARVAQMKAAGENWFGTYVLPQAVLRLKQGIGRLLRTREDRGVMAILDTRLHTKGYGKLVLNALPPARRTSNRKDVENFFSEDE